MVDRCLTMGLAPLPFGSEGLGFSAFVFFSSSSSGGVFSSFSFSIFVFGSTNDTTMCAKGGRAARVFFLLPVGSALAERGRFLAGNGRADSIERVGFASGLEQLEEKRAKSSGKRCP